jgi:hypothetical protein
MTKFLFLLLSLTSTFIWGQGYSISGQITEENTPLSFVTIVVTQESEAINEQTSSTFTGQIMGATISGDDGRFMIDDLPEGRFSISAQILGYESYNRVVTLGPSIELGQITLNPSEQQLEEVILTARSPQISREPGRLIFRVAESALSTTDSYNIITKTPGVVVLNGALTIKNRPTTIYLNNKRLFLSGPELKDFLEGLDAKLVESVEVITNPGANYDADATTVLNLKTTKNISPGYKGSLRGMYRQGVYAKQQWTTTHLLSRDKQQWYVSYSIAPKKENKNQETYIRYLSPVTQQTANIWEGDFNRVTDQLTHQAYAQWNWTPSTQHEVSLSAQSVITPNKRFTNLQQNRILTPLYLTQETFITKSSTEFDTRDHVVDLVWRASISDQTTMNATAQFVDYSQDQQQDLASAYYDALSQNTANNAFTTNSNQQTTIGLGQIDLNHKSGTALWDFGAKATQVDTKTNWSLTPGSSTNLGPIERFDYKEQVIAGFVRMERSWGKWSLASGLRYENTQIERFSTQESLPELRYENWFPELTISKELPGEQSWGMGYLKKIQRPRYQALNPFRYYLNEANYNQGNPNLVPAIEQKLNVFYALGRAWYFEAYYQQIDNALEMISFQDNQNQIYRQTDVNILDYYQYSFDVSFTKDLNPNWFTNLIASAYFISNTFIAEESGGGAEINNTKGLFLQAYNQWSFGPGKGSLEWTNTYISDLVSGSLDYGNIFESTIAYQRTLIPKVATLSLGVDDIFNTKNVAVSSVYLNQDNNYMPRPESRMIWLALRYGFGYNPKQHQKSLNDHQERSRLN